MITIATTTFENYYAKEEKIYILFQQEIKKHSVGSYTMESEDLCYIAIQSDDLLNKEDFILETTQNNSHIFENFSNGKMDLQNIEDVFEKLFHEKEIYSFLIRLCGQTTLSDFEDTRLFNHLSHFNYIYDQYDCAAVDLAVKKYIRNHYFLNYQDEQTQKRIKKQMALEEKMSLESKIDNNDNINSVKQKI
jgi:hypothetical protein